MLIYVNLCSFKLIRLASNWGGGRYLRGMSQSVGDAHIRRVSELAAPHDYVRTVT